jgi:LemA protein
VDRIVADTRQILTQEGFPSKEVDDILQRAAELQHQAEQREEGLSQEALEAGAEAAGIPGQFIEEAIRQLEAEREQETARRAARQRTLKKLGVTVGILLALIALISYGALNRRMAEVEEKRAQLENVLQRRHDLIPSLLAIAKTSATHEKELVTFLSQVYQALNQVREFEERQALEQELGTGIRRLLRVMRADPQSSSVTLFVRLSDEIAGAENRISVERKRYNEAVAAYNRTARSLPVLLVRPLLRFPAHLPPFKSSEKAKRPLEF